MIEHPAPGKASSDPIRAGGGRGTRIGLILLACAAPVLAAIFFVDGFFLQDAPPHLYLSQSLMRLMLGDPWAREFFAGQPYPVPNLLAHAVLALLSTLVSADFAGRGMMALTFGGVAACVVWLRLKVRPEGTTVLVPIALLLALGRLWLLGFWGFLIGVGLFCITVGHWCSVHRRFSPGNVLALAAMLSLGFFSHLISYLCTLLVLGVLIGSLRPARRVVFLTLAAALPSLGLLGWYAAVMAGRGSFTPLFLRVDRWSFAEILQYAKEIKLISIADHTAMPFVTPVHDLFILGAPAVLFSFAVLLLLWRFLTRLRQARERKDPLVAWSWAAAVLMAMALVSPDTFGSEHGGFLRERLWLLGLICLMMPLNLESSRARIASALVLGALLVQSAFVWEYALYSAQKVGPILQAGQSIPDGSRVFVSVDPERDTRFRARPDLHAASAIGFDRRIVVWNSYEAYIYYFPVNFRAEYGREPSWEAHRSRTDYLVTSSSSTMERPAESRLMTSVDGLSVWRVVKDR